MQLYDLEHQHLQEAESGDYWKQELMSLKSGCETITSHSTNTGEQFVMWLLNFKHSILWKPFVVLHFWYLLLYFFNCVDFTRQKSRLIFWIQFPDSEFSKVLCELILWMNLKAAKNGQWNFCPKWWFLTFFWKTVKMTFETVMFNFSTYQENYGQRFEKCHFHVI